ncbi:recombinase family protein [Saccharothrix sp. NRRL B-16314]|uniref:recombinase family protein n=1 Tax=Saccharothrix sp. NRRL B-16314 TaxID=1463825 RepID=UPI000524C607|nr:recombinase family protein [Saccharothrix sp. NRRL B-16314]
MSTTRCAIYARISEDREGAHLGVDRQVADCRELAARLGWHVVHVFTDNDISAYSGKPRPGYRALLAAMRDGEIGGVLAWHTDRLHRNVRELLDYITTSNAGGVDTHTCRAGQLDLTTPTGRASAITQAAWAAQESEHKADRVRRARLEAAREGRWQGGARPFGFGADGESLNPAEAAEIVKAAEVILAGGSLRSVVRDLNMRGVRTTFNKDEWSTIAFRDVLLRPRNAGLVVYRGAIMEGVKGRWPAILPEPTWRALVAVLTDPARRTNGANNQVRWLGSGLYLCGVCEQPTLRASVAGGSRAPAYRCSSRERQITGPHVSRRATVVDEVVERVLVEKLSRPDAVGLLRRRADAVDVAALNTEIQAVRHQLDALDDDLDAGAISRVRWARRNERLKARLDELDKALAGAVRVDPLAGVAGAPDLHTVWFGTLPDRSDGLDLGRRRSILDAVVTITIHRQKPGRRADGGYFDPESITFDWRDAR